MQRFLSPLLLLVGLIVVASAASIATKSEPVRLSLQKRALTVDRIVAHQNAAAWSLNSGATSSRLLSDAVPGDFFTTEIELGTPRKSRLHNSFLETIARLQRKSSPSK